MAAATVRGIRKEGDPHYRGWTQTLVFPAGILGDVPAKRALQLIGTVSVFAIVAMSCRTYGPPAGHEAATPPGRRSLHGSVERSHGPVGGALVGLRGLGQAPSPAERRRLIEAADRVKHDSPHATEPLVVKRTDGPFVGDAQAAWTLALAYHVSGDDAYARTALAIIEAWVNTTRTTQHACAHSGACSTSLMVSRAGPALVFAVDLLRSDGRFGPAQIGRFHPWLVDVLLPAASDRANNWGDAGTYLRAVIAVELGDRPELKEAARLWRDRIDLILPDGQIPEEIRRGRSSLMYSQEALGYKAATADVLQRAGIDLWSTKGRRGGSLLLAARLVMGGLKEPATWPSRHDGLRVPKPAASWKIIAHHWDEADFRRLAADANDAAGHSAILWTGVTHPQGD